MFYLRRPLLAGGVWLNRCATPIPDHRKHAGGDFDSTCDRGTAMSGAVEHTPMAPKSRPGAGFATSAHRRPPDARLFAAVTRPLEWSGAGRRCDSGGAQGCPGGGRSPSPASAKRFPIRLQSLERDRPGRKRGGRDARAPNGDPTCSETARGPLIAITPRRASLAAKANSKAHPGDAGLCPRHRNRYRAAASLTPGILRAHPKEKPTLPGQG